MTGTDGDLLHHLPTARFHIFRHHTARPVLRIPWKKTPMKRRREIIVPVSGSAHDLDLFVRKPAPRSSQRLRVADVGLMRSLPAPSPMSIKSRRAKNAAFARS